MSKIVVNSYYIIKVGKKFVVEGFDGEKIKLSKNEKDARWFDYFGLIRMERTLHIVLSHVAALKKRGMKDVSIVSRDIRVERSEVTNKGLLVWDRILSGADSLFGVNAIFNLGDIDSEDITEEFIMANRFMNHVRAVDYQEVIVLAMMWKSMDELKQANIAIKFAGEHHASRFMILLDYLSQKFIEGKLQ